MKNNTQQRLTVTSRRLIDAEGPDFYPTPTWVTRALIANEKFEGEILEPACGDGAMSCVLSETNYVRSSDLHDRGYGICEDFLTETQLYDNIITNPPFNLAEKFVEQCRKRTIRKFALLLRLAFLEGARRHRAIFKPFPPSRVWVFSERITMYPSGTKTAGSGTTAYAWFVWDMNDYSGTTELKWIAPGHKK